MNERIKLLAEQAGLEFDDDLSLEPEPIYYTTQKDLKKFAELIVRECADICINENVSNLDLKVMRESGKFTVQDLATKSCGENLAKRIKERFGILD
jgi:hypothetical protein